MEADCLEGDRSRGLLRWPGRLRLRSEASAAAAIGARIGATIVGTGAMIAGTDGRHILRFIRRGGGDGRRDLETPPESAPHMARSLRWIRHAVSASANQLYLRRNPASQPWLRPTMPQRRDPDRTDATEPTRQARTAPLAANDHDRGLAAAQWSRKPCAEYPARWAALPHPNRRANSCPPRCDREHRWSNKRTNRRPVKLGSTLDPAA